MLKTIFYSVLLAAPLAAGAYAPEDEQDPVIEQGLEEQDASMQETQGQETQQPELQTQDPQTQDIGAQPEQDPMQGMQQEQETQQAGGGQAEVQRAQFTTNVQDKEPVDEIENVSADQDPVYFFTEVENAAGQTITHRWKRDGEVMAEVPLEVGSDEWRTWSSKELMPDWDGEWTVEVVDAQGNTLTEESVTVEPGQEAQDVGYSPDQEEDQSGQMEQTGQQDQQGQMEQTGEQDQQAQDEEDWQDIEFEDDTATQEEPMFQEGAEEEQQDDQATEDQEDY